MIDRLSMEDLLRRLVAEGMAPPESVATARASLADPGDTAPPWVARVIAGGGAWVATGLLVGFLFVARIVTEEISALVVGAVLIGAAIVVHRRATGDNEFRRQLAFAMSLGGQFLIASAVGELASIAIAAFVAAIVAVVLIPMLPEPAHRFMSGMIAAVALLAMMADLRLAATIAGPPWSGPVTVRGTDLAATAIVAAIAVLWRTNVRERSASRRGVRRAVGYGLVAGLFAVLAFSGVAAAIGAVSARDGRVSAWHLGAGTTVALTAALLLLEVAVLREAGRRSVEVALAVIGGTVLLALVSLSTPGIVAAVALLALSFDRREAILLWLAFTFLATFLFTYYYSLEMTLLVKSIVLVGVGAVLLAGSAYASGRLGPRTGS